MNPDTETIAAVSTPAGPGGIGVIRISGPRSAHIASRLFSPARSARAMPDPMESHRLYYGRITDPDTGVEIDEVLLTLMREPHSYTREDVVEIQAHAGPVVLNTILELVFRAGARMAEPGEFTRRAFMNGRIDLTQAEAVMDVINAQSDQSLHMAESILKGEMGRILESAESALLDVLARAEAAIDFPDEVEDEPETESLCAALEKSVIDKLTALSNLYEQGRCLREGLTTVIAGRPNVGKSSLVNALIGRDRVIVTPYPGTTRDVIEERFMVRGIPVIITDTAGIHDTKDPVEAVGVMKSRESLETADVILFVMEADSPGTDLDMAVWEAVHDKRVIIVLNKWDRLDESYKSRNGEAPLEECPVGNDREAMNDIRSSGIPLPEAFHGVPAVAVSAKYGKGITSLAERIAEEVLGGAVEIQGRVMPNLRHKNLLQYATTALEQAVEGLLTGYPFEVIGIDLQEALTHIREITGKQVDVDILDRIFSTFCIGK